MDISDVVTALALPSASRTDTRVPKSMVVDNSKPTAADRRNIESGIEEIRWLAALKPTTVGIAAYVDDVRDYSEIAVVSARLRPDANRGRLVELIHRAVQYPVVVVAQQDDVVLLSLADKRRSLAERDRVIVDGDVETAILDGTLPAMEQAAFLAALPLSRQRRESLLSVYGGWLNAVVSYCSARITGRFAAFGTADQALDRRAALKEWNALEVRIKQLRAAGAKERQDDRKVEINVELQRLRAAMAEARSRL